MFDFAPAAAADALAIIRRLQAAGFVAYLAGGCVRDGLLGRQPKDFDVATDAAPETVRELFGRRNTLAFGVSFGVIGVRGSAATPTEVATFRSDGTYSDGRRPDHVRFGSAEEDALRRDFTINGLFHDPVRDVVIDFVGGRADLANRLVRAIGDPRQRIAEDKLRMLRAVRFAATLGFTLDYQTAASIRRSAAEVTVTSGERIGAELRRMLGNRGASLALELLADTHLLEPIWPGTERNAEALKRAIRLAGAVQPPEFKAIVAVVIAATSSDPAATAADLAERWKWSGDERDAVRHTLRYLDTVVDADRLAWSVVQPVLMSPHRSSLLQAAESWALVHDLPTAGIELCRQRLASWPAERLDPPPLVTGKTLIDLGFRPGPAFKRTLATIRDAQLDGEIDSEVEATAWVKRLLDEA